jgi:hypothetical protein
MHLSQLHYLPLSPPFFAILAGLLAQGLLCTCWFRPPGS